MKLLCPALLLMLPYLGYAQSKKISGNVKDASTGMPLAFVSISIPDTNLGTVTDIDGNFTLTTGAEDAPLIISHTGYQTINLRSSVQKNGRLNIVLSAATGDLDNIVITPGENPAWRIIRLVQLNRKHNDPEQLTSFRYNAYTVAALGVGKQLWEIDKADSVQRNTDRNKSKAALKTDTGAMNKNRQILERFKQHYLFLAESYTERIFRFPKQSRETVLATKISGFKSASFAFTTSNFQPFGFYQDFIAITDKRYINPIAGGSMDRYSFKLKESRVFNGDTTFVIAFEPKMNKRFTGLKGILYINSYKYAIENVTASPADEKGLIMRFRLQQKYERMGDTWFPAQLNSTLMQTDARTDSILAYWDTRSYISNMVAGQQFTNADFSDLTLDYAPGAGDKTAKDWEGWRKDSLQEKEKSTYETFDMLPAKTLQALDKINRFTEIAALEAIPLGKIDIPFRHFINGINQYEKFRLGAGFQTNPKFSRVISIGGFAGYGLGDKAFKYGSNLLVNLHERTVTTIKASYRRDLEEPGNVAYFTSSRSALTNQSLRNFYTSRLDSVAQLKLDFSTRLRPFFTTNTWVLNETRNPAGYAYTFKNTATGKTFRQFRNTEIGVGFRITSGESFTKIGRAKIIARPAVTEWLLQYAQGLPGVAGGELHYSRLAFQFSHQIITKRYGTTKLLLDAGKLWGNVPYAYLFNNRAAKTSSQQYLFIPNYFQTVGLYEFSSDQQLSLFVEHDFGSLLFKPRSLHFRPELVVIQSVSFGSLQYKNLHSEVDFTSPEKGLLESGLLLKNIYRHNMQFAWLGIGAGAFYRYGYYSLPKSIDNWAFKIALSFSF